MYTPLFLQVLFEEYGNEESGLTADELQWPLDTVTESRAKRAKQRGVAAQETVSTNHRAAAATTGSGRYAKGSFFDLLDQKTTKLREQQERYNAAKRNMPVGGAAGTADARNPRPWGMGKAQECVEKSDAAAAEKAAAQAAMLAEQAQRRMEAATAAGGNDDRSGKQNRQPRVLDDEMLNPALLRRAVEARREGTAAAALPVPAPAPAAQGGDGSTGLYPFSRAQALAAIGETEQSKSNGAGSLASNWRDIAMRRPAQAPQVAAAQPTATVGSNQQAETTAISAAAAQVNQAPAAHSSKRLSWREKMQLKMKNKRPG